VVIYWANDTNGAHPSPQVMNQYTEQGWKNYVITDSGFSHPRDLPDYVKIDKDRGFLEIK